MWDEEQNDVIWLADEEKGKLLQRLDDTSSEIAELKKMTNEGAKANDKVVSITPFKS